MDLSGPSSRCGQDAALGGGEAEEEEEEALLRKSVVGSWRQQSLSRETAMMPPLLRSDSQEQSGRSPFVRDLRLLSGCFLLVFLAYGATQNLESSLHSEGGLGSISLGVLYLSLTGSSVVAPLVVMWVGSKEGIVVGLTGYWAFMAANLYPRWYTMLPASVVLGFTASVLWVAEGTYLTFAAKSHAAVCRMSEAAAMSRFNGEFWGVFACNQVIGNLVTLAMLWEWEEKEKEEWDDGAASWAPFSVAGTMLLFTLFLAFLLCATVLACCLRSHTDLMRLRPVIDSPRPGGLDSDIVRATFSMMYERKMLLFMLLLLYTGLQQAFIWGDFTRDVVTPALGISWVGGVMAVYGAADAAASLLIARYPTGFVSIAVVACVGALSQLVVILILFFNQTFVRRFQDYLTLLVIVILWGFGDAAFNTQISSLFGTLYPYDTEAAFAQWKIWQSAATSAAFFASPHTDLTTKLCLLLSVLLPAIASFLLAIHWSLKPSPPPPPPTLQ